MEHGRYSDYLVGSAIVSLAAIPLVGAFHWASFTHIQASLVWLAATLLLMAQLVGNRAWIKLAKLSTILLALFVYALLSTILLSGGWNIVFFGTENHWLGAYTLGCCVLIGLLLAPYIRRNNIAYYYWLTVVLAAASVVLGYTELSAGQRLSGTVLQPDILAIVLGSGLLVGILDTNKPKYQSIQLASYTLLVVTILLTRTRAVIYLLPMFLGLFIYVNRDRLQPVTKKQLPAFIIAIIIILVSIGYAAPRVLSVDKANYGFSYRYDLVKHSARYLAIMPPWGLGPGRLNSVVTDYYKLPHSIQRTVAIDQKIPENSHNIFLDRFLEYGWLSGLMFIGLVAFFLRSLYQHRADQTIVILGAVGIYMLIQLSVTSTNTVCEVILWTSLLGVLVKSTDSKLEQIDA